LFGDIEVFAILFIVPRNGFPVLNIPGIPTMCICWVKRQIPVYKLSKERILI